MAAYKKTKESLAAAAVEYNPQALGLVQER